MKKRIVSIDFGLKRLGVALSDESQILASPLGVITAGKNNAETVKTLLQLLKPYSFEKIIIGHPLHLDGRSSPLAKEATKFLEALKNEVECEVMLFDERLSTLQAERALKDGSVNRKKRAKVIDSLSAVIILQCYLGY